MSRLKFIGTIEGRMGSSRLPGKTMKDVQENLPLLRLVVDRFRMCKSIDDVVVATSTSPLDDQIYDYCVKHKISVSRGSESDVLSRVVGAVANLSPDAIVQMGADSGYLDFELIDHLVRIYEKYQGRYDYVCNDIVREFPIGIYSHVVKYSALVDIANKHDVTEKEREDVVRYIWNHSEKYRILNVNVCPDYHYPDMRLTIDYPEDFELLKFVTTHIGTQFTFRQIVHLREKNPQAFAPVAKLVQMSMAQANQIQFDRSPYHV